MRRTARSLLLASIMMGATTGCAGGGDDANATDASSVDVDGSLGDAAPIDAGGDATKDDARDGSAEVSPDGALEADAKPAAPTVVQLTATSGWQIFPGGGYRYGPSIIV